MKWLSLKGKGRRVIMNDVFMRFINIIDIFFKKHEVLCLFLLFFIAYNLNWRTIGSGDTMPASLLPFSIIENHNFYLDQFSCYFQNIWHPPYFVVEAKGHYLSAYPIVTPVLISPLYIVPYLLLKLIHYPIDMLNPGFISIVLIMEKLSASIIAAISGIFVFLSLKELINRRIAIIGVIVFAFATNTWTISSQGLWQHGLAELLLIVMIYLIIVNEKKEANKNVIFMGLLSGLYVFNRPINSVLLLPILFYILQSRDRKIIYYFGSMFASGAFFLFYNVYYFGNIFGGYSNLLSSFCLNFGTIISFIGLLISPSRGLFVYTPILLLSIFGYLKIAQIENKKIRNVLFIFGFSILTQIVIYSSFKIWWAGWSYGPRFLTDMLPVLVIFLGLYLNDCFDFNKHDKKKLLSIGFVFLLLFFSIFIQIVGAFYYPNGGWDEDLNIQLHPEERLWDLNDTQIKRSFNAGMVGIHNPLKDFQYIWWSREWKDIINNGTVMTGWNNLENWDGWDTRWMKNNGTMKTYPQRKRDITINFNAISFYTSRTLQIYLNDELIQKQNIPTSFVKVQIPAKLKVGENIIRFYTPDGCQRPCDIPELKNNDSRCLSLAFQNIALTQIKKNYDVDFIEYSIPNLMAVSSFYSFNITIKNTGAEKWDKTGKNAVYVSYHWLKDGKVVLWDGIRNKLPCDMLPGDTIKMDMNIGAPEEEGHYSLIIDLVKEGITWFKTEGTIPLKKNVTVTRDGQK